jgi:hypothetical protein
MNYIDIKVTIWNRMKFSDDADMQKLARLVNTNGIEVVIDDDLGFQECEVLFDTEEKMTTSKNDSASTIEVFDRDKLIWQNGRSSR